MRPAAVILFWAAGAALVYAHLLVPVALRALSRLRRRPVAKRDLLPTVTIVVSAYNEERHIAAKIDNCLRLDYPPERLEILVVSDASTDGTEAHVRSVADPRLRLVVLPARSGKAAAQNEGVRQARHDVVFFTDATTMHPPETLRNLLRSLADPSVGCVTGRPVFRADRGAVSLGQETRFAVELSLRDDLAGLYSLLGAQDCVYAVPRCLYRPVAPDQDGGFVGPLLILEAGHRTVYEPEALAYVDRPPPDLRAEFIRRSRIVLRGLRGVLHLKRLLNPFRHGTIALALVSTRLLRWLTPVFLVVLLAANLALAAAPLYRALLALQAAFYGAALAGFLASRTRRRTPAPLVLPFYFCLLSAAAAAGLWRLLRGETGQIWQTRR